MPDPEPDDKTEAGFKARLREEATKRREALAQVADLESKLAEFEKKAATADTLAKRVGDLEAASAKAASEWAEERAVYQAGVTDPEAISVARHLHSQIPEKGRPAFAEWVGAHAKAPDTAPKALRGYFGDGKAGAGAGADAKGTPAGKAPPAGAAGATGGKAGANTGTIPDGAGRAASGAKYSGADVRAMREKAVQTGNWDEYRAHRDALLAQVTTPAEE